MGGRGVTNACSVGKSGRRHCWKCRGRGNTTNLFSLVFGLRSSLICLSHATVRSLLMQVIHAAVILWVCSDDTTLKKMGEGGKNPSTGQRGLDLSAPLALRKKSIEDFRPVSLAFRTAIFETFKEVGCGGKGIWMRMKSENKLMWASLFYFPPLSHRFLSLILLGLSFSELHSLS